MRYVTIRDGNEKLKVSKLMLGSIYFGTTIPDQESFYMMDTFLDAGGTMIDTARCYANWLPNGEGASEKAIGRWINKRGNRGSVLIGTKGGNTKQGVNPYRADLSKEGLTRELNESLKCLNTSYVDLYWLHRDDPRIPVGEIVELVNEFVKEGKARMLGVSNWGEERLLAANQYANEHQLHPFVINQIQFSLAECTSEEWGDSTIVCMDREKEQWYRTHQIPVAAFTSQGQGFYTKVLKDGAENLEKDIKEKFYHGENINRIERVRKLSECTGYTVSQIVLGYLVCNEVETTALIGNRTIEQLADSLSAADVELSKEQIKYLRDGKA
jgi:aryl-alcohol dehydrogenase-like predicted oxidoreductase